VALYNLDAARGESQRRRMEALEAGGVCLFCRERLPEHERQPLELSGTHWYVTKNDFPYEGTTAHYLIVSQRHVTSFEELPDEAGAELWAIKRELKGRLEPVSLATVERSGNMLYNGASIAHLHVHLVALDPAPSATVRFRVSARAPGDTG
jgi:ATP adenylyltransferase